MRHEARQVPSWLIFDVSQMQRSRCAARRRIRSIRVVRESFDLWDARVSTGFRKEASRCQHSGCRVGDRKSRMKATLAVPETRPKEARREFVVIKSQTANKAPEPTPTSVTPRAISRAIEVKRQSPEPNLARGAPDAVVAHL